MLKYKRTYDNKYGDFPYVEDFIPCAALSLWG